MNGVPACFPYTSAMRVVVQKVTKASVRVGGATVGMIGRGYLLFVCVMQGDSEADGVALGDKIANLRLFEGANGKINDRSIIDISGDILVISQFTLAGDTRKGNRPDYTSAASPDTARALYEAFIAHLKEKGITVASGEFGAHMDIESINDGPVTLIL